MATTNVTIRYLTAADVRTSLSVLGTYLRLGNDAAILVDTGKHVGAERLERQAAALTKLAQTAADLAAQCAAAAREAGEDRG